MLNSNLTTKLLKKSKKKKTENGGDGFGFNVVNGTWSGFGFCFFSRDIGLVLGFGTKPSQTEPWAALGSTGTRCFSKK